MTDAINYLNQYQAQQPNMLDSYDDTQGMARSRPADPLRWLANAIGQNKDLPAPQFFMDPRALSVRNMLHSGLQTSANWLDGTRDPSLIGPQEMVSPTGFGLGVSAASAAKNAMSRPARDFRIAEQLARQHPEASAVGTIPRYAPLRDASNPTSAAHVYDYGMLPGASRPANVMADNAKGSAPGTIINSLDMSEAARMQRAREMGFDTERPLYHGTKADFDEFRPSEKGKFGSGVYFSPDRQFADEWTSGNGRVIEAYGRGKMADDAAWAKARDAEYSADGSRSMFEIENAAAKRLQSEGYAGVSSKARGESVVFDPRNIRSTQAAFDPAKRDSAMLLAADNAKGSAPGTVVNSFAEGGRRGGPAIEEVWGTKFQTHMSKEYEKAVAGGDLSTQFDILSAKYANSLSDSPEIRAAMKAEMDRIEPQVRADEAALREELRQRFGSPPKLLADNAKGSAPGTVVNSLGELPPVSGDLGFGARVGDASARYKAASQREKDLAATLPHDLINMGYRYRFNPDEMIRATSDNWASSSEKALRPLIEKHRNDIEAWARAKREADRLAYESDSESFLKTISESGRNPRSPDEPMAVYHGTDAKFDKYSGDIARSQSDAAKDIGMDAMFVTPKKEFAAGYGTPMPLDLRKGHYFDVTSTDDLARIAPYINSRPDAAQMWKKIEKRVLDGGQTWGLLEGREMAAAIKAAGYDGVRMTENYHTPSGGQALARTMAVFSKGKVTKRGTDDVVFSSPSASTPGLAANSTQQDDQGVMSILRRYGLAD